MKEIFKFLLYLWGLIFFVKSEENNEPIELKEIEIKPPKQKSGQDPKFAVIGSSGNAGRPIAKSISGVAHVVETKARQVGNYVKSLISAEAEHKTDEPTAAELAAAKAALEEQQRKELLKSIKAYQHKKLMEWQAKAKIIRKKRKKRNRIQKRSRQQNR